MEYRPLGAIGFKVPVLTFGTGTFGGKGEFFKAWGNSDVAEATRIVDVCLEAGLTMFDSFETSRLGVKPSMSHVIARLEVRQLITALNLPLAAGGSITGPAIQDLGSTSLDADLRELALPDPDESLN